jgi:hypothetical protein
MIIHAKHFTVHDISGHIPGLDNIAAISVHRSLLLLRNTQSDSELL